LVRYLLDTNAISEIYKPAPDKNLVNWLKSRDSFALYLSVISIGELRRGLEIKRKRHPDAVKRLEKSIADIEQIYAGRVWTFDQKAAQQWGRITAQHPNHLVDAQIAAIAIVNDAVVVTRNIKDFKDFNVKHINPFDAAH
jgi:predicted nucleic acid-binding protein